MKTCLAVMAVTLLLAAHAGSATNSTALVQADSRDFGDTTCLMKIVELKRNAHTSKLRLTYQQRGSSVGSSMFIMRGFYAVAKARGAAYFVNLKEWDDQQGGHLFIAGFTNTQAADLKQEFGKEFDYANEYGQKRECLSVAQFGMLFERQPHSRESSAPTNRAVAVLQRIINDDSQVCCTLHAMSCMRHEAPIDFLVIDESSMLSSDHGDIISHCGAAKRAALLFVGDDLQLLPVGCGEIFRPLLKQAGLSCLTKNLRAHGDLQKPIASIREGCASEASSFGVTVSKDSERHQRMFEDLTTNEGSVQVLALRNEDRVNFCCFAIKKHHVGADDDYSSGKAIPFYFKPFVGEPVRFQKNTYKPLACRGSIGVIMMVAEEVVEETGKQPRKIYVLEVAMSPEGPHVQVQCSTGALAFELRPAFAITVHDAQGGEFDHIHIIMPPTEKSPLCTLEMLYTAASRARKSLKIWCINRSFAAFEETMCRVSPLRATPFKAILKNIEGGEPASSE